MKIIDCHAHIFPDKIAAKAVANLEGYYNMPWSHLGTADDMRAATKDSGIYKTVVFSTATTPAQVQSVNNFMSGLNGGDFIAFGSVHPDYDDVKGEIARVKQLGLRGFKFHPDFQRFNMDDDKALFMYEAIGSEYPILIHNGDENQDFSAPRRMGRLAALFPEHTFIAAHLGGYANWDAAEEHVLGKNIYIDTSSSLCRLSPEEVTRLIRLHGADKVLFGTDYPAVDQKEELAKIQALGLTEEEERKILSENAMRLLGIV
jgi:predicted TIM-barrel fold metal-dependent hydrolase